jgi:hypothetical protein
VNLALVVIRLRHIPADTGADDIFGVPLFVPIVGIVLTVALLTLLSPAAYLRAAALMSVGIVLHLVVRRFSSSTAEEQ